MPSLKSRKRLTAEYQPTVSLSTKRRDNYVLISVKDNGNGIPQNKSEKKSFNLSSPPNPPAKERV